MRGRLELGVALALFLASAATVAGAAQLGAAAEGPRFGRLRHMLPLDDLGSRDVLLADVDGDGDADAFVATDALDRVLLNDGSGVFRHDPRRLVAEAALPTEAAAFGDVDGDGDLDLARAGGPNRLSLNVGGGRFVDASNRLSPAPGSDVDVAFGDVDGDGDLDLWFTGRLFVNDGSGGFADATAEVGASLAGTLALALGDVEGDGDLDAVLGTAGEELLLLGDGDGGYADASAQLPSDPYPTVSVALGDVEGDGDLDLALADRLLPPAAQGAQNRLYLGDGSGVFADATGLLPAQLDQSRVVRFVDYDGDDDLDLYFGNDEREVQPPFGPPVAVAGAVDALWRNDGGTFADATPPLLKKEDSTRGAAFGDVDGDADADLLLALDGVDRLLLGDGTGAFGEADGAATPEATGVAHAAAVGDVNGDGVPDVLLARGPVQDVSCWNALLLGDGTGRFVDATGDLPDTPVILYGPTFTADVELGDVDGDGDLDAVCANPAYSTPQDNFLWLNDGTGVFVDATDRLPSYAPAEDRGNTYAVELLDLENDGDLDIVLAGKDDDDGGGGGVAIYVNDGKGVFTDATALSPYVGPETETLLSGDVDGDGDVDLVTLWANAFPLGTLHLLLNDGGGAFSDGTGQLPSFPKSGVLQWADLGDLEGDGDLDLVFGRYQDGGPVNLQYRNDGDGFFTQVSAAMPAQVVPHRLADVDGDGDLDLVASYGLFLNDGTGAFFEQPNALPAELLPYEDVEPSDLDGDDDVDVLVLDGERALAWSNLTHQLAWRGLPRAGKPLVLDVKGPPSEPYLLSIATGTIHVPTPWGVLRIDPGTVFFTTTGALDATGRDAFALAVPGDPTLVGAAVVWQAAVGLAPRLTNLERTTFTGF